MLQQHFAVGPAFAFFANEIVKRNLYIVEVDFVHFVLAVEHDNWRDSDARRFHIDQHEADPLLAPGDIGVRSDQAKYPVGILTERRPGLGAVDNPMVTGQVSFCFQRGKIGSGTRFGIALGPPGIACKNVGEKPLLLRFAAKGVNNRPNHVEPKWNDDRRVGAGFFARIDVLLHGRPACSTVLNGPIDARPTSLKKDFLPTDLRFRRHFDT